MFWYAPKLRSHLVPLIAGLGVSVFSCGTEPSGVERELDRARARWAAQNTLSYDYVLEVLCFCPFSEDGPVRVTVSNGAVVSRIRVRDDAPVDSTAAGAFVSIDELFEIIGRALDSGAASISAVYDAALGYPLEISIDYIRNAVDDEVSWRASDLRLLLVER